MPPPSLHTVIVLALGACVVVGSPATAGAQGAVSVLRIEPGADPICAQIEDALSGSGFAIAPDPGYFAEAERSGLDPASPEALQQLVPLVGADVVVVPMGATDDSLAVALLDGRTGAPRRELDLPLDGGGIGFVARNTLVRETRALLGSAAPPGAGYPSATPPGGPAGGYGAGADADDTGFDAGDDAGSDDEDALGLRMTAGVGVGTRSVDWPTAEGATSRVDLGAFTAVEVGALIQLQTGESFAIGGQFTYQSSFLHEVDELHEDGVERPMAIRAHRLEAALVPELRFGDSGGVRLGIALGYGLRSLRPEVHHLLTPDYTLGGPVLRPALRIPVSDDVALHISPEGQLVVQVSDELQERGVEGSGIAFGGQAALEVAVAEGWAMELAYRESHALLGAVGGDAEDVERFGTARIAGEL